MQGRCSMLVISIIKKSFLLQWVIIYLISYSSTHVPMFYQAMLSSYEQNTCSCPQGTLLYSPNTVERSLHQPTLPPTCCKACCNSIGHCGVSPGLGSKGWVEQLQGEVETGLGGGRVGPGGGGINGSDYCHILAPFPALVSWHGAALTCTSYFCWCRPL